MSILVVCREKTEALGGGHPPDTGSRLGVGTPRPRVSEVWGFFPALTLQDQVTSICWPFVSSSAPGTDNVKSQIRCTQPPPAPTPQLFPRATSRLRKEKDSNSARLRAVTTGKMFSLAFLLLSRPSGHPLFLMASHPQGPGAQSCLQDVGPATPRHLQLSEQGEQSPRQGLPREVSTLTGTGQPPKPGPLSAPSQLW